MQSIKRILFIAVIVIAGVLTTAVIVGYLFRDDVKNIVITSLNKQLTTKVEVGDITFSIIKNFPYPSLELNNVIIHEPADFTTSGQVVNAEKITLMFSFQSLFSKSYSLKKISILNALINIQVDKDGSVNYKIWKKNDASAQSEDELQIELENVVFDNTDVLYYNIQKDQDISFLINNGTLSGNFQANTFDLKSKATLEKATVILDQTRYLNKVDCSIDLSLNVDRTNGLYRFTNSHIQSAGLVMNIEGEIVDGEDYFDSDLKVSTPSADLPSLISFIPEKFRGPTKEYNYSGKITFNSTIKGRSGPDSSPEVKFNFESIDVNLNPKNSPYHIKKMNGKGFFTNRKSNATPYTFLKLENFSAILEGKPIKVNLEVENFKKPVISFDASLEADLNAMSKFFMPDTLESMSGTIIADVKFNGVADQKYTYKSSGEVRLKEVGLKFKQKPVPFRNVNGTVHLKGNDVMVENLSGKNGQSDFIVNGYFNNLVGFLLLDNQKVDINASLQSQKINLDELMTKDTLASSKNDTVYRLNFSDKLKFRLEIAVGDLQFKKFDAKNISGIITLENKVLNTKELNFNTAGGSILLSGTIDDRPVDSLRIDYIATANNLNIRELFYELGNFGQTALIDKNLKGNLFADVRFNSMWSDRLQPNENSIRSSANITIENGELINFEPMLALSSYLKGSDLKTIKFSTLTNSIEIRNRKIYIPLMEIKSSAADIIASGDHSFDNIVNYKLRLYLSQLLGKKIKAQNTEFGTIEDDGLGRPMIFLTMTGPASDPKIALDMNGMETKITDEIKNEAKSLKNIFKEEFGKKDTANKSKKEQQNKQELQIDYDDEE